MEPELDDLLPLCKECNGTGRVDLYAPGNNPGSFGRRVITSLDGPCEACQGHGAIPTSQGRVLIEFIQRAKEKTLLR